MATITVAGYIGSVDVDSNRDDPIVRASIADNQKQKKDEETIWYSFTLFGKFAEKMGAYIKKGAFFVVSGQLVPKSYQTNGGESRMSLNIYNPSLTFGPKNKSIEESKNDDYYKDDGIPF